MTRHIVLFTRLTCLSCAMLFCIPAARATTPITRKELITMLQDAIQRKDLAAIENLYLWDNVSPEIRTLHRDMFKTLLSTYIESIAFAPLTEEYETELVEDGQRYNLNVPVKGLISIAVYDDQIEKRGTITIPYGQVGKYFYLAGLKRDEVANSKYNYYTISMQGLLFPDPVVFKGIYMFEKDGQQLKKKFEGKGYYKETIEADALIACVVKKDTPEGWIKMAIRKNGVLIYEGKESDSSDTLIYKAP